MAHPFHVHGAQFTVIGDGGSVPQSLPLGAKDTVFVREKVEILVRFSHPATTDRPFLYHCHVLEHEDAGMMGAFIVG